MNQPLVIAGMVGLLAFVLLFFVFSKLGKGEKGQRTRNTLKQLMEESSYEDRIRQEGGTIMKDDGSKEPMLQIISVLPFGEKIADKILKAGMAKKVPILLLVMIAVIFILGIGAGRIGINPAVGFGIAIAIALYGVNFYLDRRVNKRNDEFIKMFPDVLDMIVRSVRSGFPLNTAIKMVAENMEPPVSTEFRQVADEVALGMSMDQALHRLSERVDEPDIHFFVVVLNVQAETGGNLAEIISNLSGIIRKRKQLRQKIKAMTSEGRATAWVLGALPVVVFLAISYLNPKFFEPLYDSLTGNIVLVSAVALIGLTFWVVNQMVDIDI